MSASSFILNSIFCTNKYLALKLVTYPAGTNVEGKSFVLKTLHWQPRFLISSLISTLNSQLTGGKDAVYGARIVARYLFRQVWGYQIHGRYQITTGFYEGYTSLLQLHIHIIHTHKEIGGEGISVIYACGLS